MKTSVEIDLGACFAVILVDFYVTQRHEATFEQPEEGGEVEINRYEIIEAYGKTWEKTYSGLGDWAPIIDREVYRQFDRLVDLEDLYTIWSES